MRIESEASYDAVVIGGGIAGCVAAIEASRAGASVCLASSGGSFSGSSFYPGTWGLGLVGPIDASDADDLTETIVRVGHGAADAVLVESFVRGIPAAISTLEAMGVALRHPENPTERQYVPCFDHKLRMWRGLDRDAMRRGFDQALRRGNVARLDGCELLDIRMDGGRIAGVLLYDQDKRQFCAISCGALVLAAGGMAGLYGRSLSSPGNFATAQALAAHCGARLTNMEFMQIMPGLVSPRRNIVFNEKAFRLATARDAAGNSIAREALESRSEYGPLSCERLGSAVDFAMEACGGAGMDVVCDVDAGSPEFVRTYSEWLARECGVSASDPVRIAPYAHASNGGIAIDERGSCGVDGLFAAGECTGGMHGGDRIGGLASANALVFGMRAGSSAAKVACFGAPCGLRANRGAVAFEVEESALAHCDGVVRELQEAMSACCLISRNAEGLAGVARTISALQKRLECEIESTCNPAAVATTLRCLLQLETAAAMVFAMLARKESCGSHYRSDAPRSQQMPNA